MSRYRTLHVTAFQIQVMTTHSRGKKKVLATGCVIVSLTCANGRPVGAPAGALAVVDGLAEDAEPAVALVTHHGTPVSGKSKDDYLFEGSARTLSRYSMLSHS